MSIKERAWRNCIMFLGIFGIATGISLATKSDLGTTAISVIPYTISLLLPQLSYGTWVALFNFLLAFAQIIINEKGTTNYYDIVKQLVISMLLGYFVNAAMFLLQWYHPSAYWLRFVTLLLALAVLAFGAYLTLISHAGVGAGDGFARSLSKRIGKDFGTTRVISDSSMVAIAVVLNLVFFHTLICVREGTIVAAICSGLIVRFYFKHLQGFEYFLLPSNREEDEKQEKIADTGDHFVITIAREHGSGGQFIGRELAEKLGIAFYDSEEIAKRAAALAGVDWEAHSNDEFNLSPLELFYARYAGAVDKEDESRIDRMFQADSTVIREIAAKENCVIVGRLANWVLEDHQNLLRVFISASKEDRIAFVMNKDHLSYEEAEAAIARADRRREEHCRYCTGKRWYDADGYDLTLNVSRYPNGRAVDVLLHAANSVRV